MKNELFRTVNMAIARWRGLRLVMECLNVISTLLRTVPPWATVHTFCASRESRLSAVPAKTEILFSRFITSREKQILAMVIGIRKEN